MVYLSVFLSRHLRSVNRGTLLRRLSSFSVSTYLATVFLVLFTSILYIMVFFTLEDIGKANYFIVSKLKNVKI